MGKNNKKNTGEEPSEPLDLKHYQNKFQTIIELAPDAFFQGDADGNLITINNKAIEITGYSKDELLSMNIADLFSEKVKNEKPLRYDLLKKGETIKIERELIKKTGESIVVEMSSKAMPDGTFQSFIRDITDRIKAEEKIRTSEQRLSRAELASKTGNWELYLDTKMVSASEGATKIYGVEKDVLGYDIIKKVPLLEYRSLLDSALVDLIAHNKPYDVEFKIKAVNTGEIKDIHSIAIFDKEKNALFGVIQDITARKKAEDELKMAKEKAEESDKLKTEFLNNMSHEIRTPLNGIVGFANRLEEEDISLDERRYYVNIINNCSDQLTRIIDDILEISQLETKLVKLYETKICLNTLMLRLFSIFDIKANENKIPLYLEKGLNDEDSTIYTDELKLNKILGNLLENALKYTNSGNITFGYELTGDNLEIYIKDTGIGIKEENYDIIFERFSQEDKSLTGKKSGLGLGLSIARENAHILGGSIKLVSEKDKGSVFTVIIPYKPVIKKDISNIKDNKSKNPVETFSVLIVEDDEVNVLYLEILLNSILKNNKIFHAKDGKEAVNICKKETINIVLMDIKLPEMDGYTAAKQIFKLNKNIPVIAQTAYAGEDDKNKALSMGFVGYITKPIDEDLLKTYLHKFINPGK